MHKNIARMTMENTAMLYGYKNIDEFEASIKQLLIANYNDKYV